MGTVLALIFAYLLAICSVVFFFRLLALPEYFDVGFGALSFIGFFVLLKNLQRIVRVLFRWQVAAAVFGGALLYMTAVYLAPYWLALIAVGGILLLASCLPVDMSKPSLPTLWSEDQIRREMLRFGDNPVALSGFYEALYDRFVVRQNEAARRERVQFLKTVAEELKLRKQLGIEWATRFDQFEVERLNWEIQRLEKERDRDRLKANRQREDDLADLRQQRDALSLQLEIAEKQAALAKLQSPPVPPKPERKPTAEQERKRRESTLKRELVKLAAERDAEVAKVARGRRMEDLDSQERAEVARIENHYNARMERIRDELDKLWRV